MLARSNFWSVRSTFLVRLNHPFGPFESPFWFPIFGPFEPPFWFPIFGLFEPPFWFPVFGPFEPPIWSPVILVCLKHSFGPPCSFILFNHKIVKKCTIVQCRRRGWTCSCCRKSGWWHPLGADHDAVELVVTAHYKVELVVAVHDTL